MHSLSNKTFEIKVKDQGAELCSFFNKEENLEYIWQADPKFWKRHAPVLFPIVGSLKNGTYKFEGKEYQLPQHGFARDENFKLKNKTENSLTFLLQSSESTIKLFPYSFELQITYELHYNSLVVMYAVKNTDNKDMYFSIGAHPAFNCPLYDNETYQHYYLDFETEENVNRWFLEDGLLSARQTTILEHEKRIPLNRRKFDEGALIFKKLRSNEISLISSKSKRGIKIRFEGFPYLGIWAKPGADFICIEPWFGITDNYDTDQNLETKEGIQKLSPNEEFETEYAIVPIN